MDKNTIFRFICHWHDPHSELIKKFLLKYYCNDDSIELYDVKNKKLFLKKYKPKTSLLNELFLDNTITLLHRNMILVEYADEFTALYFINKYKKYMIEITNISEKNFYIFLGICQSKLNLVINFLEKFDNNVYIIELRGEKILEKLNKLRIMYTIIDDVFLKNKKKKKTEKVNKYINSSLILIKSSGWAYLSEILLTLYQKNFKIGQLKSTKINKKDSLEFFKIYQGILNEYISMSEHLSNGKPVLAIEIILENNFTELRQLIGPYDPEIGKLVRSTSLRSLYGSDKINNALHINDLQEDGKLECEFFFNLI